MSCTNNNQSTKVPQHGRTTNTMWNHVQLLKDDDQQWLQGKKKHQCKHCSWTCSVYYTKTNKVGIVSYKILQVERHLLEKHKDLKCCKDIFMKKENNTDEKKRKIQASMAVASMDGSSSKQRNLRQVSLS